MTHPHTLAPAPRIPRPPYQQLPHFQSHAASSPHAPSTPAQKCRRSFYEFFYSYRSRGDEPPKLRPFPRTITSAGKRRVSLNALRHGLTGHTVVLPSDDLAAYQKQCGEFYTELKPQGLIESKCVQTIADTYWRLDRIRAMENSLFGLAIHERTGEAVVRGSDGEAEAEMSPDADPVIDCALAQAKALEQHSDLLTRLSLYEQRLNRTLEKTKAELKQLQKERVGAREKALYEAAKIANLKEALDEPWQPRDDGFEFSTEDVTAWRRRTELDNAALRFFINGSLPAPPDRRRRK